MGPAHQELGDPQGLLLLAEPGQQRLDRPELLLVLAESLRTTAEAVEQPS